MPNMLFANNANTTLASSLTNVATTMSVTSASAFPSPTGSQYFYCTLTDAATQTTIEIVKVTAVSGTTFTIVRGQDGTTGTIFASGAVVSLRLVRASLNDFPKLDETNTFNADQAISGQLTSSAGLATTGTFTATAPSDGLVMDYATGFGRFSAFAGDGFQWFNSGIANTKLMQLSSSGVITTATWNGATVGVGYGGTGTSTAFTAGSVVYAGASGVYSQDNSNFFWDATNHRLGIGTTSPTYKLNIAQAGYSLRLANSANSFGYNIGRDETSGFLYFYGDQAAAVGYVFTGAAGEWMRISSSGGVSIGNTTDPGAGNLRFNTTGSNGIYFGSSSKLADYEEGTWTPSFYGWTGTYAVQWGTYVKVGRMILLQATITTNGGTGTFSQTYPNILGLPFSIAFSGNGAFGQWFGVSNISPGVTYINGGIFDYGAATQFFINLTGVGNTGIGNLTNTMLSNSANVSMRITACYETT